MKCRLCTQSTSDEEYQHFLYDDNGQNTEVYEITVQYFEAVLNIDDKDDDAAGLKSDIYNFSNVICNLCWGYIREFNEFQQRILRTLHQLMADYKSCIGEVNKDVTDENVKVENDDDLNEMNAIGGEIVLIVENGTNEYYKNDDGEDETEDNVKDLQQEDKIKSNVDKDGDDIEKNNDKSQNKTKKVRVTKEFTKSPRKLRCRKGTPKESSDANQKSAHNNSTNKTQQNDDPETNEDPDNIKDLLQKHEIKSNGDSHKKNEDIIENENVTNSEENIKKNKKESSKCSKKRKVTPDENSDNDTSTHYNCLNSVEEINQFITQVKPQLECDICKESLKNYNELRKHFKEKHQEKCFVVCCGKKIYRRYLLSEHLRIHVNPNIFKCDICDVISSSSRAFSCHKRFMHGDIKMFECKVCLKNFKTQPILNRHMEIHNDGSKDFECPDCDRCYKSSYQLKAHIRKFHNELQICEQCGKEVRGKRALNLHIINQHGGVGIKPNKFPCDKCDAKLASKKGLKIHQLAFHNDLLTAFICKICGKIASSITALENHKKYVHEMERKHKCQYCDKAFKKMSNLKEHISVHTGEHLYRCYHCPLTFGNSANMHNHRKKVHPAEFALCRENRVVAPKIDLNCVNNEVLL